MKKRRNDLPKLGKAILNLEQFFKRLPDVAGVAYQNFVLDNFQDEAWEGKAWQPRQQLNGKKKQKQSRRALLVKTGRLRRSIRYRVETRAGRKVVIIYSDVPYAQAHNEGLKVDVQARIKAHTRRTARGKVQVQAHTRKQTINLPERRFMGHSNSFNQKLEQYITKSLKRLR
jgi:phage gpG-like protein